MKFTITNTKKTKTTRKKHQTRINGSLTTMLCVMSLFGCSSMHTNFQQPELNIPEKWTQQGLEGMETQPQQPLIDTPNEAQREASKIATIELSDEWWTLFKDPLLNSLIDRVFESNSDLERATIALKKARLEAGVTENNKRPTVSFSHNSSLEYDIDADKSDSSFGSSLSLNYELDLWGRVDSLADADKLTAFASYEERENTAQILVVTTAMLYWKVGYLNQKLMLTEKNINGTERIATLTNNKYNIGSATRLEVLESTHPLFNQQVQRSQLENELSETQNAISILLNQPLEDTKVTINQLPLESVPNIEAGIPSELLLRRPDVKATLFALRASLATKDAIYASYMPTFALTSSLNTSSSSLLEFLENPIAKLGSGVVLPFLEWQEMELNKGISELDYQMAIVNYRDSIYQAFEDVDNLLTEKKHLSYQGDVYEKQFKNAQEIERIYASRYQYGESNIIDWINVMETRRNIESSVLENKYDQFVNQVKLYQSLGGGDIAPEA